MSQTPTPEVVKIGPRKLKTGEVLFKLGKVGRVGDGPYYISIKS
jgi:hypothetical protein